MKAIDDYAQISAELLLWAQDQIKPWTEYRKFNRKDFAHLDGKSVFLFEIKDGLICFERNQIELDGHVRRAEMLRDFLTSVASKYALPNCSFVYDTNDCSSNHTAAPLFVFQRIKGHVNVMLPDIDFLASNFYASEDHWALPDSRSYAEKHNSAVFAGSTTGGGRITRDSLLQGKVPRVQAARYFKDHPHVKFLLPKIVQCSSDAADDLLAEGFGKGRLSWQEQLVRKFTISIDGNGATCSRVLVSLRSNSVLLKYRSSYELFYFRALSKGKHFIEIVEHKDVLSIVDKERNLPGTYAHIALESKNFAERYLSREALCIYTSHIFQCYAKALKY